MKNKPILLVTASTFPRWKYDSEPRFVFDLCTRLANSFTVIVLTPHYQGAATKEVIDELQIHRYRYAPSVLETLAYEGGITANLKKYPWKWLLLPGFLLGQWIAMRRLMKQYPVSVIHAHWLIPQGLVAILAKYTTAQKPSLFCTSHGGDLYGLQDKISQQLKRWVIRNSQAITVVSTQMVEKIRELTGDQTPPISIIPMGTDLENTFVPNLAVKRLPNQLLFVGRLVEKKGVEYLLQALVEVRKVHPDMTLVIAGSGPLRGKLETLALELGLSGHVRFAGRLEHAELVRLYQESTLAVFPFIQTRDGDMEGLGLVMVEAMGCECPVIASDMPAGQDIIQHIANGYLVESGNSAALASGILALLKNPAMRMQLASRGLQTVRHAFDWQSVTQRYQSLLQTTNPRLPVEVMHAK